MPSLSDTLARLAAMRSGLSAPSPATRLVDLTDFGANPGALAAKVFYPEGLAPKSALVVVLHGCTQTAAGYDAGSGWSQLAEDFGFALLYPEQQRGNNANLCFNWFERGDTVLGQGEVGSIRQMIDTVVARNDIDPRQIFITGLSAGGAMANAMLAVYPQLFAGGAILSGLAYGMAASVPQAFERMRGLGLPSAADLQQSLRAASDFRGPWPAVSIWQGGMDTTVVPSNADALAEQWRGVHAAADADVKIERGNGFVRRSWSDAAGTDVVTVYTIDRMAHGTPIHAASGYGTAAPFMLETGISSSEIIAASWGITPSFSRRHRPPDAAAPNVHTPKPHAASGIQATIENALRSAGLLK